MGGDGRQSGVGGWWGCLWGTLTIVRWELVLASPGWCLMAGGAGWGQVCDGWGLGVILNVAVLGGYCFVKLMLVCRAGWS